MADMDVTDLILGLLGGLLLGLAVGAYAALRIARPAPADDAETGERAVVRESLDRLHDQLRDLEHARASWQGQLAEQVADVRRVADGLGQETRALSSALRKPQVRGRWGELHLRRTVEAAGLVDHCDFEEQVRLADGADRPDLVVRLAGGRHVVVDAKVPLDAFLDAQSAEDDALREHHLDRHARQVRTHVERLGSKAYWRSLAAARAGATPDFVVLFVPAEAFLAAALDSQRDLIEYAAARDVVIASPTTLIALLRTIAHGWRHQALTDRAEEIRLQGRELHDRLATWTGHLDQLGRSLNATVGHYNSAVGSLDSRVLVSARRFAELGGERPTVTSPRAVETPVRSLGPSPQAESPPEERTATPRIRGA